MLGKSSPSPHRRKRWGNGPKRFVVERCRYQAGPLPPRLAAFTALGMGLFAVTHRTAATLRAKDDPTAAADGPVPRQGTEGRSGDGMGGHPSVGNLVE